MLRLRLAVALAPALVSFFTAAADDPAPRQRMWIAKDFKFHTGEAMAELILDGVSRHVDLAPFDPGRIRPYTAVLQGME